MTDTGRIQTLPDKRVAWFSPAAALLLLAPVIGEVLSGATRVSYLIVLIPEIMVWGCGAVLIREAVRRWDGGWTSMALLGLGLSVAEEFVIQQTSLAPLPWPGSSAGYGRVFGVNWVYFLFMLGFETVFIVLVPIQVAELLFSGRRRELWLRTRGLVACAVVFALGSRIAWYLWTQRARPFVFHAPIYAPPMTAIFSGVLAIALLAAGAYALRRSDPGTSTHRAPPPLVVGLGAMLLGFPWYALMGLVFVPRPGLPLRVPMLAGVAWAIAAVLVVRRWSSGAGWNDRHRWALVFGALVVCMVAGFFGSESWPRIDVVGKLVLNGIAAAGMIVLARRIWRQTV